jgi:alpha-tubulin suppressor-like RCC1 family protein
LGLGNEVDQSKPKEISFFKNEKIKEIQCGDCYSFVWTENGLFGFGINGNGELGLGNKNNQNKPQEIPFFKNEKILQIHCGASHAMVLTSFVCI